MKIIKEKTKTILSLTEKELDELMWMVYQFDACNDGVGSYLADAVKVGRKWCKALGMSPQGYVCKKKR